MQGKIGELGISQDKWKAKCHELKRDNTELRQRHDSLQSKYDLVCQSQSQLQPSSALQDEVYQLRATVAKREQEIREVVVTLKKFSDDKKALEQELLVL